MAIASTATVLFCCAKPSFRRIPIKTSSSSPFTNLNESWIRSRSLTHDPIALSGLIRTGLVAAAFIAAGPESSAMAAVDSLQLSEPANALSLPTWAVHVSSVVEWITRLWHWCGNMEKERVMSLGKVSHGECSMTSPVSETFQVRGRRRNGMETSPGRFAHGGDGNSLWGRQRF
ncbi:PREDICTED: uncharacterized protein LOC104731211 isoform X1 [Camelina sativa]|uniref:Uncharacterized protein LOC104731211 isoform X1 n=1 Tax=Camelina sativa TaxID=90675 RepID=A0ABM0V042_CAMSA|nr:PREDICTED: uncharacterized protein LOC104731211 isoform X1 [Camelina sativa]